MSYNKNLFRHLVNIQLDDHLKFVINNQKNGGWAEEIKQSEETAPSPLVTAQMIIGLIPFTEINEYVYLQNKIKDSIRVAIKFLINKFYQNGWSDHSATNAIIDATGAALTASISAIKLIKDDLPLLKQIVSKGIEFVVNQQNKDGGWSIAKGGISKIQYTYWALKSIISYENADLFKKVVDTSISIELGTRWIVKNFEENRNAGFSLTIDSNIGAISTAFGIEILEDLKKNYDKSKVRNFYEENQLTHGKWAQETDQTTLSHFPRRVYVFNDYPRILECFAYLDVSFDSRLFQTVLLNIKGLEIDLGGFNHKADDQYPIGWFTAQVLKMTNTLIDKFINNQQKYEQQEIDILNTKKHFSKMVLMIGRYQPPHIGHYHGFKAIIFGDEDEFYLPLDSGRELVNIDKVYLGIARMELNKNNPFSVGEIRDIWRQVIDNDHYLKKMNKIIEIVSCPSEQDTTNVVRAIDELTSNRDTVIVVSGNNRIIEQCKQNKIKHYKFKRKDTELRGTKIRDLISKIDLDNIDKKDDLIESLKLKLHPVSFDFMLRTGLMKKAKDIINAI